MYLGSKRELSTSNLPNRVRKMLKKMSNLRLRRRSLSKILILNNLLTTPAAIVVSLYQAAGIARQPPTAVWPCRVNRQKVNYLALAANGRFGEPRRSILPDWLMAGLGREPILCPPRVVGS